jgi:hypothetical protein
VSKGLRRLKSMIGSLPREFVIALVVTIVATVVVPVLVSLLTKHKVYLWVLALTALVGFLAGLVWGTALGGVSEGDGLKSRISELESRTGELGEYETYAEHVRDALGELRKVISREMPSVSTRDFIEIGIFEPAHRLLHRDHRDAARGDVRFSILVADGDDFVMADASSSPTPRPALDGSISRWSRFLSFRAGVVDGVLNVLAVRRDAFSPVDRTYITLLASVIDVARSLDAVR